MIQLLSTVVNQGRSDSKKKKKKKKVTYVLASQRGAAE